MGYGLRGGKESDMTWQQNNNCLDEKAKTEQTNKSIYDHEWRDVSLVPGRRKLGRTPIMLRLKG